MLSITVVLESKDFKTDVASMQKHRRKEGDRRNNVQNVNAYFCNYMVNKRNCGCVL